MSNALRAVGGALALLVAFSESTVHVATQATQRVDRSKPPVVEANAGGFTVRRLTGPVTIDGRAWIEVPGIIGRQTVRAPNGQFTLTLEEASSNDTVRFRVLFSEGGGTRVPLDPGGAVYASITRDSRWILIDPIDIVDVRNWRRYNLSKLFDIDRYVGVRAVSADGRRLFISRQPCPFDCQGIPNEYFEIGFPPTPEIATSTYVRWPLSDGIQAVSLADQKTFLLVDIAGPAAAEFRGEKPTRPSAEGLQVWILRRDGTAVPQRTALRESAWGSTTGGYATLSQEMTFQFARFADLAGVVVSVNGKLFAREMPATLPQSTGRTAGFMFTREIKPK